MESPEIKEDYLLCGEEVDRHAARNDTISLGKLRRRLLKAAVRDHISDNEPKRWFVSNAKSIAESLCPHIEKHFRSGELFANETSNVKKRRKRQKLTKIIPGGAERWESSYNAIKACTESTNLDEPLSLLLHDAARPFVSQRIIADVCQALETHEAVTVAVPVTDTIYEVRNNEVQEVKNRRDFMRAQTPQAFHLHLIAAAFEDAIKKGYITSVTDDVAVLKAFNPSIPVFIVPGEESNKKITYPEDIK